MKQRVKILTVSPSTRVVEAMLKDKSTISIQVWEVPAFFRWPRQGEFWTVNRDGNFWVLDAPMENVNTEFGADSLAVDEGLVSVDKVRTSTGRDVVITQEADALDRDVLTWDAPTSRWMPAAVAPEVIQSGRVTGNAAALTTTYATLFSLNYTTARETQGRMDWQIRATTSTAAWNSLQTRLQITPAPTLQMRDGGRGTGLVYLNSGAAVNAHSQGFDYFKLAAGTAYRFEIQAIIGGGTVTWPAVDENEAFAMFWAL